MSETADGAKSRPTAPGRRKTEKVSEVVAREIVRDCRGLPPGTKLPPEAKLLERYNVGRASLREALRVLEVQGLIVIRPGPGGGPIVAQADSTHFGRMASLYFEVAGATYRDTLGVRLILEPVAAGMIAQQQDPEHIQALKDFVALSKATIPGPPPSMPTNATSDDEKALEFHAMLMSMSGNPVLGLIARSLQDLHVERRRGIRPEDSKHFDEIHEMIAIAIIENRPELAEQLMREHMRDFAQHAEAHDPTFLDSTVAWQ